MICCSLFRGTRTVSPVAALVRYTPWPPSARGTTGSTCMPSGDEDEEEVGAPAPVLLFAAATAAPASPPPSAVEAPACREGEEDGCGAGDDDTLLPALPLPAADDVTLEGEAASRCCCWDCCCCSASACACCWCRLSCAICACTCCCRASSELASIMGRGGSGPRGPITGGTPTIAAAGEAMGRTGSGCCWAPAADAKEAGAEALASLLGATPAICCCCCMPAAAICSCISWKAAAARAAACAGSAPAAAVAPPAAAAAAGPPTGGRGKPAAAAAGGNASPMAAAAAAN